MSQPTVLVTGAAKRIGRAIALDLADHGWQVIIHYNKSQNDAEELASLIRKQGGAAQLIQADLALESQVQDIFPKALSHCRRVDCLINNASTFTKDTAQTTTRGSWDSHLEPNLRAPFVLSQAFAKQLPKNHTGTIINMIDQCVWNLTDDMMSYTVSKYALWGLTQTLALAFAPQIRVNGIGPGPTLPNTRQTQKAFQNSVTKTPLKRGPSLDEICSTVRYILDTPSLTGQMIALDGGQHLL